MESEKLVYKTQVEVSIEEDNMDSNTQEAVRRLTEATKKSKCSACGSEAYGRGCIYGPNGLHLHMDDPSRCGWCGSKTTTGKGCIYSPTGYHGIGANLYTTMPMESFMSAYFLRKLKTPVTLTSAYRLGVVNENGTMIKKPTTDAEIAAYTVMDSFLLKLKKFLGVKLDLISENMYLELSKNAINENCSVEHYEKEIVLKRKLTNVAREFNSLVAEARKQDISEAVIDKTIMESFSQ